MLQIDLHGRTFYLHRPADLESMWEKMAEEGLDPDERIPYWVELWPASIVLAKWLLQQEQQIVGARCLDLGCGLGLCTQAAASCRARVVGMDYVPEALGFAQQSAPSLDWVGMDWRKPCFQAASFSYIFGADILYESRFFPPLLNLWAEMLAPGGRIWIATPERQVSRPFWERILPQSGWQAHCLRQEDVSFQSYQNMSIFLWEITAQSQSRSRPG
ncbi:MAG: class I SAM-dependent methyltransferase [Desulfovermiculus sp.]|nr:class I SAM-dependent methyltransferase [Desulfovermiculus sp.]